MSALIPFRINQSRKKGELEGKKRKIKKWATQIKRYKNWIKNKLKEKNGEKPKSNEKKNGMNE